MTYEVQAQALCDHRVHREFTYIDPLVDPDHRSLRIFQPISNENVRLWYNGKEYLSSDNAFGWSLVRDEFSSEESPKKKVLFKRAIKDANAVFELSYTVSSFLCRKCFGLGVLYDQAYNTQGRILIVNFEQKLMQQIIKILFTRINSNPFVPGYGTTIPDIIYSAIRDDVSLRRQLLTEVSLAISKHKNITNYQSEVQSLTAREIIDSLGTVDVSRSEQDPRVFYISIEVNTLAGDTLLVQRELFMGESFNNIPLREAGII